MGMKVLIVGGGGREHALAWGMAQSAARPDIYTTSANPGLCALARCADIEGEGVAGLADWAAAHHIDLTVVGPEAQLSVGIVDEFNRRGLAIFGPTKAAAELEWSKAFAKELMARHQIPTARFAVCGSAGAARRQARTFGFPVVIKADGLAAGKGVTVCRSAAEADAAIDRAMAERIFGEAGDTLVVEEFLTGEEASVHVFASGTDFVMMPAAQDHKAVFDGDQGPNTGGMGAYSPAPVADAVMLAEVAARVVRPTLQAMAEAGRPFTGALYTGLMIGAAGPKVVEFNCRFGDPETQVIVPRLASDLLDVLQATAAGRLSEAEVRWHDRAAVCVVLASAGYPGHYETGLPITGVDAAAGLPDVLIFHAGTARRGGELVTAGGRVLGVTALGNSIGEAVQQAYAAVGCIEFPGMHYRRDIAYRALARG